MKTMKKALILTLLLGLLCACSLRETYEIPTDTFYLDCINNAEDQVYALGFDLLEDGEAVSGGGVTNADGSSFQRGERISREYLPKDFPDTVVPETMTVAVTVYDREQNPYPAGEITVKPTYGGRAEVTLTGSAEGGYHAEVSAQ